MIVFLNGRFVPEEQAVVSVFDRGFLYGDGVFEAVRILNGRPFRWQQHVERLQTGLEFLKIELPCAPDELKEHLKRLVIENNMPDSLLRLTVSRGVGKRGYSPEGANSPSVVLSLHPVPAVAIEEPLHWKLITSNVRLPAHEPLAHFKTCAKIPQILARAEADRAGADDALLVNSKGFVVEGSSSNLFWFQGQTVCTAPLPSGILPGVTRSVVLELCSSLGWMAKEFEITPDQLAQVDGVFLSLSSLGIVECASLDRKPLKRSGMVQKLSDAYWQLVKKET